jgi:hypothetical protein
MANEFDSERLNYTAIAAGQTAAAAFAGVGAYLSHVVFQPAAVNAGTTTILDGTTVIYTYTAGTLSDLRPITVAIGSRSQTGSWNITTGASMAALAFGKATT